ncbi:fungal-specific transcription factor domain-containing protein [Podospora fimiseda]|uniref:Fungal-specific transcription factor domain-containing protein n=1 Tax=Podospora fimiseda TaxID=252190 RepID=A0AAN6YT70_9PEZI|nr:fungal-specific transcription factor domain-containing protein [Podospora fimiseda]
MNRSYVVDLQKKVRMLEEELSQFTEEEGEYPHSFEEMMRPGGLVRLDDSEETARYLGPSSGIAMTRLLMEEAKRFTETQRISDLIPKLNERRRAQRDRMQSVIAGSISAPSGKRYPQNSDIPAPRLLDRQVVDKFVQAYHEKVQIFAPVLHEQTFAQDLDAVYAGDQEPYKLFVVNIVLAISIQKMGRNYQGLAKSYFLSAMQHFEDVIRPKDLKTLQCLCLITQYSLLTPIRTAVYYVVGLATRICQQLGLNDERAINVGAEDAPTLDMRRRLSWIVTCHEYGLAHVMGRPNGFAKCNDSMNVKFFEAVADSHITPEATPESLRQAPPCPNKLVAIHFCKMRILQAEIRRVLYEKKRDEPTHDRHPWFSEMEQKMEKWRDDCPSQPLWCNHWFKARYETMVVFLYRPSFQVPKPSSEAAIKCFDGAERIITMSSKLVDTGVVDVTWVFLLTIYTALNSLLWSVSYPEVRAKHDQQKAERLVEEGLDIITRSQQCGEEQQWPGVESAVELYVVLSKACLQSYDAQQSSSVPTATFNTPLPFGDHGSPESEVSSQHGHQPNSTASFFGQQASPFGYVVEPYNSFDNGSPFTHQPSFRSNSIFGSTSADPYGRRFSQFAPDSVQQNDASGSHQQQPMPTVSHADLTPPQLATAGSNLPTPPESLAPNSAKLGNMTLSPRLPMLDSRSSSPAPTKMLHDPNSPVPTMLHHSAQGLPISQHPSPASTPAPFIKTEPTDYPPSSSGMSQQSQVCMPPPASRTPAFTIPAPMRGAPHTQQQRPGVVHHWHQPPPPLIQPHAFTNNGNKESFWNEGHLDPFSGGLGVSNGTDGSYTLGGGHSPGNRSHLNGATLPQPPPPPPPAGQIPLPQGTLGVPQGHFPWEGFGGQYFGGMKVRNGSVTHTEQLEMISQLEGNEGMLDIDSFLNMGMGPLNGFDGGATYRWN